VELVAKGCASTEGGVGGEIWRIDFE